MVVTNDITAQHTHTYIHTYYLDPITLPKQTTLANKQNLENAIYNDMVQCYQPWKLTKDIQHIGAYNSRVTHIEGLDIEVSVLLITR